MVFNKAYQGSLSNSLPVMVEKESFDMEKLNQGSYYVQLNIGIEQRDITKEAIGQLLQAYFED